MWLPYLTCTTIESNTLLNPPFCYFTQLNFFVIALNTIWHALYLYSFFFFFNHLQLACKFLWAGLCLFLSSAEALDSRKESLIYGRCTVILEWEYCGMNFVHSAFNGSFILLDHTFPIHAVLSSLTRRGHCVVRNLSHSLLHSTLQLGSEDLNARSFFSQNC